MRHQVAGKHLGRTSAHRNALRRNLAASLFEHGTISTTIEKAKFVRPFAEKLITLAKDGSLHARRRAISLLQDRKICKLENGEPVQIDTVIGKLFKEIGPGFADRNGGYTRIIRLPWRRIGDNGTLVLLQLVTEKMTESKPSAPDKTHQQPQPAPGEPTPIPETENAPPADRGDTVEKPDSDVSETALPESAPEEKETDNKE